MRNRVLVGQRRLSLALMAFAGLSLGTPAFGAKILMDFGNTATGTDAVGRAWNNIGTANDTVPNKVLNDTTGTDSGYRLTIANPPGTTNAVGFNAENTNGTPTPSGQAAARSYPSTATEDNLYGNVGTFNGLVVQGVRLTFSNLSPTEVYSLDFFASRLFVSDNRETEYAVTGAAGTTSVFLNPSNNEGNVVGVSGISPVETTSGSGLWQIVVDIDAGPNNNNTSKFFHVSVAELNSTLVPEPASLGLLGGALVLLGRRRRV
ncbi:MAG TPA: PEP-CTERM sorting domain-containing protein [Tepidisphaeraceae bacterium]|jgi:hypothetical protein|nr:PEP-CTERM sorting domain-containing protein [Tepidisphaeraceae bacterium]